MCRYLSITVVFSLAAILSASRIARAESPYGPCCGSFLDRHENNGGSLPGALLPQNVQEAQENSGDSQGGSDQGASSSDSQSQQDDQQSDQESNDSDNDSDQNQGQDSNDSGSDSGSQDN